MPRLRGVTSRTTAGRYAGSGACGTGCIAGCGGAYGDGCGIIVGIWCGCCVTGYCCGGAKPFAVLAGDSSSSRSISAESGAMPFCVVAPGGRSDGGGDDDISVGVCDGE